MGRFTPGRGKKEDICIFGHIVLFLFCLKSKGSLSYSVTLDRSNMSFDSSTFPSRLWISNKDCPVGIGISSLIVKHKILCVIWLI